MHTRDREETIPGQVDFDHHSSGFREERWEIYRRLREECPVAHTQSYGGFWTIARYEHVFEVARDDETFSSVPEVVVPDTDVKPLIPLESDPPDLARYRAYLAPFFTLQAVRSLEPIITTIVDDCLERILPVGECEAVAALCDPLPARTTLHLLGLEADYRLFSEPLHLMSFAAPGSPEHRRGERGVAEFEALLENAVDERIRQPRDDMISRLTSSEHRGRRPTRDEVLSLVRMMIFGGFDTVFAALSTILVVLDERRDLRQWLIEDVSRIPVAIEEFLRHDAPVQGFARTVMRPCTVGGREIASGERVFMLWASANRDPAVFEKPDDLVLDRWPNRHMTFGIGGHRCLGATLARTELRIALERILEEIPDYDVVADEVEYPRSIGIIAGAKRVPLRFPPRRTRSGGGPR